MVRLQEIDAETTQNRFRFEFTPWEEFVSRVPCQTIGELNNRWQRFHAVLGVPYTIMDDQ